MPADITPQTPDITPIMQLVRKTRTLLRSSWVVTGLGLTVAEGIITQHGGSISASNRPEGGARLEICLPAA